MARNKMSKSTHGEQLWLEYEYWKAYSGACIDLVYKVSLIFWGGGQGRRQGKSIGGAKEPRGSRGQSPLVGVRGRSPLKLKPF